MTPIPRITAGFLFLLVWALSGTIRVQADEPNWPLLNLVPILGNSALTERTVDIQNAADGSQRLFLIQQAGFIRIYKDNSLLATPFLDISARVALNSEQGLLGVAFPPGFATKLCFYVCYTRLSDRAVILSRFRLTANADIADSTSEEILLVIPKNSQYHNGGQIAFGPDGYLYIAIGDDSAHGDLQNNSQDLTNRLGKVLRIDVGQPSGGLPYSIPASNPFAGSGTRLEEILCWGLRNPWRFSFDQQTGDLYLGDVGESQREEVNYIPGSAISGGRNFGWSVKEGTLDFKAQSGVIGSLQPPAFEYDHTLGSSIVGGYFYRGLNPRLQGFYLFGDFSTGQIMAMESPSAGGRTQTLTDTDLYISTFGRDEAGEIYLADYYTGGIYRVDTHDTALPARFMPLPVTYQGEVYVTIFSETPNSVIRYTTDGTSPTISSPEFEPGSFVQFLNPTQVRAIVFRNGLNSSPVAVADYQLRPYPVQFTPPNGTLNNYTAIQLSCATAGTTIRYTLDGSTPNETSPLYSGTNPFVLTKTTTVKAIAFKTGWLPSFESGTTFYFRVSAAELSSRWSDLYEPVHLTSATTDAVIHYTLDGSTPTQQSPVWTGPQDLPAGTTINTLTMKGQMEVANSTLVVTRIQSEEARFQRVTSNYFSPKDVVLAGDGHLYAVGLSQIWKISDGTATVFHQGGFAQDFKAITFTSDSELAVADAGTQDVIQFSGPSYGTQLRWEANPVAAFDLVSEPGGSFILADFFNQRLWRITASGHAATIAGTGAAGSLDGPALQATFNGPAGVARAPDGRIYVAEKNAHRIRMISPGGQVSTVAGTGVAGWLDGSALNARFESPNAIARDRIGNLYVSEGSIYVGRLRKIHPDGTVTTLHGPVMSVDGASLISADNLDSLQPTGLDVDEDGTLFFAVGGGYAIFKAMQKDWDNDGIPDELEPALGLPFVVGVDDRLVDQDGDLYSNCAEWIAGTNPLDPAARPNSASMITMDADALYLYFRSEQGQNHQLEFSDDMHLWKPMGQVTAATLHSFTIRSERSPLIPSRFFRLRKNP